MIPPAHLHTSSPWTATQRAQCRTSLQVMLTGFFAALLFMFLLGAVFCTAPFRSEQHTAPQSHLDSHPHPVSSP